MSSEYAPYIQRFIKETDELTERIDKLENMLNEWDTLDFEPSCPKSLLQEQLFYMKAYRRVLKERLEFEDIAIGGTD